MEHLKNITIMLTLISLINMYTLLFRTIFGFDHITFEKERDMIEYLNKYEKQIISFSFTYKENKRKRI